MKIDWTDLYCDSLIPFLRSKVSPEAKVGREFKVYGNRCDLAILEPECLTLIEIKTVHEQPKRKRILEQLQLYSNVSTKVIFVTEESLLETYLHYGLPEHIGIIVGKEDGEEFKELRVIRNPLITENFDTRSVLHSLWSREVSSLFKEIADKEFPDGLWGGYDKLEWWISNIPLKEQIEWKKKAIKVMFENREVYFNRNIWLKK